MNVQVLQHMHFQIRGKQILLNSRGFLAIGPGGSARCFVCGLLASWCMLADVNSPLGVKAVFVEAGSDIGPIAHYSQVSACGQHKNNLFDLCVLVHENKDIITPSIIRQAMNGAYFFVVPVTYRFYQSPRSDPTDSRVEIMFDSGSGFPKEVCIHFAHDTVDEDQLSEIIEWISDELGKTSRELARAMSERLRIISRLTEQELYGSP